MAYELLKVNRTSLILVLLALIFGLFWNELNIRSLKTVSQTLSIGKTVMTADDASYLVPAENYLKGKGFRNNLEGRFSNYMRPPGYSFFYLSFRFWLPQKEAIYGLKFFQLLLFGLSVSCLFSIFLFFDIGSKLAAVIVGLYAISGISIGFLYYTLTEAITPSFLIFLIYFLVLAKNKTCKKEKRNYYLLSFLVFGFLFITRPVLGIFALPILFFILYEQLYALKTKFIYLFAFFILGFLPMTIWQIRSANIAGEIIGLHPIYSVENKQTPYRPIHQQFWEFAKSWGENGDNFHTYTDKFWLANYSNSIDKASVENIIKQLPNQIKNQFQEERIDLAFTLYAKAIVEQKEFDKTGKSIPKNNFSTENKAITAFKSLTSEYRLNNFWKYNLFVPLKVFNNLIFHSNLSLYIFQKTFRGNPFMELSRFLCFLIHSLAFLLFPFVLLHREISAEKKSIFLALILSILYLIYFQRGIEERYTLPFLPIALLALALIIQKLLKKVSIE